MSKLSNDSSVFEANQYYPRTRWKRADSSMVYYGIAKRVLDMIGACLGLLVCLPLFIVLAIRIKLEDPKGHIFFYQQRVGKDEKVFNMYKLRSMVSNAEELLDELLDQNEMEGHMFKMKEDPRITKVGKFMRRTSMDELPQLWNVLKGDMSLVGPRPPLLREVEQYSAYHKQRLQVTPGCTGLWQVSGRNDIGFEEMVELDLTYIRERKLSLEVIIIMRTFRALLGSKNAY
ncbi:sugar transferase [Paenibacillus oryzisoli]|uniref:Multidrug MFS transporter n=1 Tax=Paenibacillus oryzisoli TaxID=1850517 RepID=A0A198A7R1_9BACL|nr:sugar transferase [Paenibacillus oryzisoli]OAS17182.1 multidrug MFS transporter [Paenibacillus oryzisoli]